MNTTKVPFKKSIIVSMIQIIDTSVQLVMKKMLKHYSHILIENNMPEDFKCLWYDWCSLKYEFDTNWQELAPYESYINDRDLFCMYLMISI